ncbi:electron transfer flavoprotein subunit beta, partial [candidate division GN15 bacterium]|nr:electron transfer flavoprotein subunit beta [candidate division GN15 bacterium]
MNIVVLVKQVPEIALVKVDESANQVELPKGPGTVNPFDEYAVEEALRLKEKHDGK